MSTRDQEARALGEAWRFLLQLGSGEFPARPVSGLRAEARRVLRHYPLAVEERWKENQ